MTNTETLYNAMRQYQQARSAARDEYLQTMKRYEADKGSNFYRQKQEEAARKREAAVSAAQAECKRTVDNALSSMKNAINTRKMIPPTEEQLRILQMLKMRDKVSRAELETAANSMDGNGSALAVLNEIARANEIPMTFSSMAKEGLAPETATQLLRDIAHSCGKRIQDTVGANYIARMGKERHARMYGGTFDPDDLPQEAPYQNEQDFFSGITSIPFDIVSKSLN